MTAKEICFYALDQATAVVVQVQPEQHGLPTPDAEWDVHNLLNHMVYELAWAGDIVSGKTIAQVGTAYDGDLLDEDGIESWRHYEKLTRKAVEACDEFATAHLSYGDTPVRDYLLEVGNDLLVHAWDLGQAINVSVVFEPAVAKQLYERALTQQDALAASGLFAPPVPVAPTANVQTRLLALLGRSENWVET